MEILKELWGEDLFDVFAGHLTEDGWLPSNWNLIIENEIPQFDKNWNDNPKYTETYQRMYMQDLEENEDGSMVRPKQF